MKAIVAGRYGAPDVLTYADVPKPLPKPHEVLIKMRAASVTLGDCEVRAFKVAGWIWLPARLAMGITRPRQPIWGMELAGDVVETGAEVTRFKVGDRVFGSASFAMGTYAQFKCTSEKGPITQIPAKVSYEQAVGIPTGGLNALHFLRHSKVQAGEKVLINGAGGSIGTFAVQLAKLMGAEVTAVDRADKLDMLTRIGAEHVVDYQSEDFTQSGKSHDVIIDVVGNSDFDNCLGILTPKGRYFLGNPRFWQMMRGLWVSRKEGKRVLFQLAGEPVDDLDYLAGLVADGAIDVVIDRHFDLKNMADAHRHVEAGDKQGIVVIDIPQDE